MLRSLYGLSHLITRKILQSEYYPHFSYEETEAQQDGITCFEFVCLTPGPVLLTTVPCSNHAVNYSRAGTPSLFSASPRHLARKTETPGLRRYTAWLAARVQVEGTGQVQATLSGGTFCLSGPGPSAQLAPTPECQEQAWPGGSMEAHSPQH